MTVYKKIVRTKSTTKEISKQLRQYLGVSYIKLGESAGLGETTLEFICSDADPVQPRTMKDIDNLLMHLDITKVLDSHRNDPLTSGASNHLMQISTDKAPDKDDNEETKEVERA